MEMQRSYSTKFDVAITPNDGTAGTGDLHGGSMDMQGYSAINCEVRLGTISAGATLNIGWQYSDDNSNWHAVPTPESSTSTAYISIPETFDDGYAVIELTRPLHRYYRLHVDRGNANSVVQLATYHRWRPFRSPVRGDANARHGIFVDHDNS